MRAKSGDWLIAESNTTGRPARRGRIEEVQSPDGSPPFLVRWADTDHVALAFPGPDAYVVTEQELASETDIAGKRFSSVQHESSDSRGHTGT